MVVATVVVNVVPMLGSSSFSLTMDSDDRFPKPTFTLSLLDPGIPFSFLGPHITDEKMRKNKSLLEVCLLINPLKKRDGQCLAENKAKLSLSFLVLASLGGLVLTVSAPQQSSSTKLACSTKVEICLRKHIPH